jgi:hypothetical protein
MTPAEALMFVRKHGVVLEAANGPVPSLASAIAGEPIRGSWWSHEKSGEIFKLTRAVRDAPDVLVCRLVNGSITYVHRRLWPALVRAAERFPKDDLAEIHEQHTTSGRHVLEEIAFPGWVPPAISAAAEQLDEQVALTQLGDWVHRAGARKRR